MTFGEGDPNEIILESAEAFDIFVARHNPDGTLAWAESAGGTSNDKCYGITTLFGDSTVVTGGFKDSMTFWKGGPWETVLVSDGGWDIFVARFAP